MPVCPQVTRLPCSRTQYFLLQKPPGLVLWCTLTSARRLPVLGISVWRNNHETRHIEHLALVRLSLMCSVTRTFPRLTGETLGTMGPSPKDVNFVQTNCILWDFMFPRRKCWRFFFYSITQCRVISSFDVLKDRSNLNCDPLKSR